MAKPLTRCFLSEVTCTSDSFNPVDTTLIAEQILFFEMFLPDKGIESTRYLTLDIRRDRLTPTGLLNLLVRQLLAGGLNKVIVGVLKAG